MRVGVTIEASFIHLFAPTAPTDSHPPTSPASTSHADDAASHSTTASDGAAALLRTALSLRHHGGVVNVQKVSLFA
jgi:hypothetical protein